MSFETHFKDNQKKGAQRRTHGTSVFRKQRQKDHKSEGKCEARGTMAQSRGHKTLYLEVGGDGACFNLSTQRQSQTGLCAFKDSLVYIVSTRTTRAIQRDPV